jgi:transposase-like protein
MFCVSHTLSLRGRSKNGKEEHTRDPNELLDQLLAGRDPRTALDSSGLIGDLKKALAERILNAEMDVHLAKEAEAGIPNHRDGTR